MNSILLKDGNHSKRSLIALDWLNFFISVMRGGIGPYMVIYFSHIGFNPSKIGTIIAFLAMSNALGHVPAGHLVDKFERRRELLVLAMLFIVFSILIIMCCHNFIVILLVQIVVGLASALIPPVIGALSMGLVGHDELAWRLGRNDAFNHVGNVMVAACIGIGGLFLPVENMMILFVVLCAMTILVVFGIRKKDINNAWAQGLSHKEGENKETINWQELLKNRLLLIFLFAVFLFHLTNSALLPLVIQKIINKCPDVSAKTIPLWSSSCIVMAELVMIFAAILAGKLAHKGRKIIFIVCYILVAVRAFIFAFLMQPIYLVAAQSFDGISAGMYSVIGLTILSDIVYGSGRFNLSQGFFNACTAIGIAASNYLAGILIDSTGYSATANIAGVITLISVLFVARLIPETRRIGYIGKEAG